METFTMENKLAGLTSEAIDINTKLFNKSVEFGVESAQQFIQNASDRTGEWLKIKTLDDYVATQESWNKIAIDQTTKFTKSITNLGNEAYSSYMSIWQKFAEVSKQPEIAVPKKKAA